MLASLLIDVQNVEVDICPNLAIANPSALGVSSLDYGIKI
jgi:hypothetical protein